MLNIIYNWVLIILVLFCSYCLLACDANAEGEITLITSIMTDPELNCRHWTPSKAGDLNNDGYDDLIVGLPMGYFTGNFWPGMFKVYLGGAVFDSIADVTAYHIRTDCPHGIGDIIAPVGDINGDGYDDVALGAETECVHWTGDAYIYLGSAELDTFPQISIIPYIPVGSYFGHSIASLGDIDGDNYDDFIVGAPEFYPMSDMRGSVFIFDGGDPFNPQEELFVEGEDSSSCGTYVSGGDFDGDGTNDLLIAFPFDDPDARGSDTGYVRLYPGDELDSNFYIQFTNEDSLTEIWNSRFIGDINGDGYDDVGIHRRRYTIQRTESIEYIYFGSAAFDTVVDIQYEVPYSVRSLSVADDVDGDGFDDLLYVRMADDSVNIVVEIFAGGRDFDFEADYDAVVQMIRDPDYHYLDAGLAGDLNNDGKNEFFVYTDSIINIYKLSPVGIDEEQPDSTPKSALINNISPNPTNSSAILDLSVEKPGKIMIRMYDLLGRRIQESSHYISQPGDHSFSIDLSDLSSGIYFINVGFGDLTQTKKLVLLK